MTQVAASPKPPEDENFVIELRIRVLPKRWHLLSSTKNDQSDALIYLEKMKYTIHLFVGSQKNCRGKKILVTVLFDM